MLRPWLSHAKIAAATTLIAPHPASRGSALPPHKRRYRLRVRTWPSQGQNPGSNPGIATNRLHLFFTARCVIADCYPVCRARVRHSLYSLGGGAIAHAALVDHLTRVALSRYE